MVRSQTGRLSLARSYEFSARLLDFTNEQNMRQTEWFESPLFRFIEPLQSKRCGNNAFIMHRTPDRSQFGFELRSLNARAAVIGYVRGRPRGPVQSVLRADSGPGRKRLPDSLTLTERVVTMMKLNAVLWGLSSCAGENPP
jgi:hypothetical protein